MGESDRREGWEWEGFDTCTKILNAWNAVKPLYTSHVKRACYRCVHKISMFPGYSYSQVPMPSTSLSTASHDCAQNAYHRIPLSVPRPAVALPKSSSHPRTPNLPVPFKTPHVILHLAPHPPFPLLNPPLPNGLLLLKSLLK